MRESSTLSVSVAGGREGTTITLRGEIDVAVTPDLEERAMAVLRLGTARVNLDLSKVTLLSSAGIGALVRISQEAHRLECAFVVTNPSPFARRVLETTGLIDALNVQSDHDPLTTA